MHLLGTVIDGRGVAVGPGMDGVGGARGGRLVEVREGRSMRRRMCSCSASRGDDKRMDESR